MWPSTKLQSKVAARAANSDPICNLIDTQDSAHKSFAFQSSDRTAAVSMNPNLNHVDFYAPNALNEIAPMIHRIVRRSASGHSSADPFFLFAKC